MGRGDYVKGYYRGDPGLFGAIGHVLGGAVGGFITGGPLGAIRGAITGTVKGAISGTRAATLAAGGDESAYTPKLRARHAAVVARGRGIGQPMPGVGPGVMGPGGGVRGYIGSGRRRRLNPLNVKALRRADRRARSFLRITRSIVKHYVAKAPKGKSYIHFKKKSRAA
jgi:hypothetical protein